MSSKKLRFEIFKRDKFTCRYCGGKSPSVILEVDHIVPRSSGGNDDQMNLVTSCFSCNRGKSDRNLSEIITGENPHDKAVELMEKERQLAEYYVVRQASEKRICHEAKLVVEALGLSTYWDSSVREMVRKSGKYDAFDAIEIAIKKLGRYKETAVPYAFAILRNWENDRCHT